MLRNRGYDSAGMATSSEDGLMVSKYASRGTFSCRCRGVVYCVQCVYSGYATRDRVMAQTPHVEIIFFFADHLVFCLVCLVLKVGLGDGEVGISESYCTAVRWPWMLPLTTE